MELNHDCQFFPEVDRWWIPISDVITTVFLIFIFCILIKMRWGVFSCHMQLHHFMSLNSTNGNFKYPLKYAGRTLNLLEKDWMIDILHCLSDLVALCLNYVWFSWKSWACNLPSPIENWYCMSILIKLYFLFVNSPCLVSGFNVPVLILVCLMVLWGFNQSSLCIFPVYGQS